MRASKEFKEIEIIHPMVNKRGLGILDGNLEEMMDEISKARSLGKGIYAMKVLGGGHLISQYEDALTWAASQDSFDSIAVGMQSESEVLANVSTILGKKIPEEIKNKLMTTNRKIDVEEYCIGCGKCKDRC
ncbi:MAG: aldo/keto reductase, partial [Gallicola sp.]|nr:aldo/keto reductase [Gallicola sp.]